MATVKRFDTSSISGVERTPQGGLRVPARPTRAGVFLYRNVDGSERYEYRPESEVFNPDSLKTLKGATVTDLHPAEAVSPGNYKALTVGHVSDEVTQDGMHVSAPLIIQDGTMIRKVENKEAKELSCGYECEIDSTPGVFQGQRYDTVQRKIVYNHVAIGPEGWGRAGSTVAIRLDSGAAVLVHKTLVEDHRTMKTVRIDGVDYEIGSESHLQAVARRDAAQEAKLAENATVIAKVTEERDVERKRADTAEASAIKLAADLKTAQDPKTIHKIAKGRSDMIDKGRRVAKVLAVKFDEVATEGATDEGSILLQILKMIEPGFAGEGMSPDMIKGYALAKVSSLISGAAEETAEVSEMTGADTGTDVHGSGTPPTGVAPGRSDSGRLDAAGARAVASAPPGAAGVRKDAADPEAAKRRNREDSAKQWEQPLGFSKDHK